MAFCALIDHSERPASIIELYNYPAVTKDNLTVVEGIMPLDQLAQVEEGDALVIYIVDNRPDEVMGILTVWGNKSIASIDTGNGTVWGDWKRDDQLVLTLDIEAAADNDGNVVRGRIAYNSHGIKGIYSDGRFYTIREPVSDVEPGYSHGQEKEPNFLCHDEENHTAHICQLKNIQPTSEIKHRAQYPKVSCLLCESLANSADHVCSPVTLE